MCRAIGPQVLQHFEKEAKPWGGWRLLKEMCHCWQALKLFGIFKDGFILCLWVLCLYACIGICMCGASGGQKRAPDILELELGMYVNHVRVLRSKPGTFPRAARALNHWVSSLPPLEITQPGCNQPAQTPVNMPSPSQQTIPQTGSQNRLLVPQVASCQRSVRTSTVTNMVKK